MSAIRTAGLVLALVASSAASVGQETAAPPPAAPRPTAPASQPPAPAPAAQSPAAPRPAASDDLFIPTEELSADEQVTFPVDI